MKYYFMFFLLVLILSCNKENNQTPNSSNEIFPNEVGNHWVYKYDDADSNSKQFIIIEIVGRTTIQNGVSATIWTSTLQDASNQKYLIDSSYVVVNNETAVFYAPPCLTCTPQPLYEKRRYVFPLQVGNLWYTHEFFGDTTKVLNENILVPAGTFKNTFQLSKTIGYVTNSFTKDSIWLTPNIGMTKYYQNEYSLGPYPGNGTWELASYNLK